MLLYTELADWFSTNKLGVGLYTLGLKGSSSGRVQSVIFVICPLDCIGWQQSYVIPIALDDVVGHSCIAEHCPLLYHL
jgi:hypothetical protein